MPRTIEVELFKFDELDDKAKEKARDWFREGCCDDSSWYEFVYEDAETCAGLLGIELDYKSVPLMGGGTRRKAIIYFSGFWSQGDGACFEGRYSYAKGAAKKIRDHAPKDKELHRIADGLQEIQRRNFYRATLAVKHRGHYHHSGTMHAEYVEGCAVSDEGELLQLMRDFADWIYKQLEQEYEYQHSAEVVDENIRANEYEFNSDGSIA